MEQIGAILAAPKMSLKIFWKKEKKWKTGKNVQNKLFKWHLILIIEMFGS